MGHFLCPSDRPWVARYVVKHHSECVCEGVLDETNIRAERPSRADCPPSAGGPHPISGRPEWTERPHERERPLQLPLTWNTAFSSAFGPKGKHQLFLDLGLGCFRTERTPPALLGLQVTDYRSWRLSAAVMVWATSFWLISFCRYTRVPLVQFLWRTPTSTKLTGGKATRPQTKKKKAGKKCNYTRLR